LGDERGGQLAVIRRIRWNWLAEHHNVFGIVCAATVALIAYSADGTRTICAGSRGIMLPNHASLVVAEQFGTLRDPIPSAHRPRAGARSGNWHAQSGPAGSREENTGSIRS